MAAVAQAPPSMPHPPIENSGTLLLKFVTSFPLPSFTYLSTRTRFLIVVRRQHPFISTYFISRPTNDIT